MGAADRAEAVAEDGAGRGGSPGHKLEVVEGICSHVSPGMQRRISAVLECTWQKSLRAAG